MSDEKSISELKPCPFCGEPPFRDDGDTIYPTGTSWATHPEGFRHYFGPSADYEAEGDCWVINCTGGFGGCGAEMHGDSKEEVIEKWNTRN